MKQTIIILSILLLLIAIYGLMFMDLQWQLRDIERWIGVLDVAGLETEVEQIERILKGLGVPS